MNDDIRFNIHVILMCFLKVVVASNIHKDFDSDYNFLHCFRSDPQALNDFLHGTNEVTKESLIERDSNKKNQ